MHQKNGKQGSAPKDDLKNFYIKVSLNKESIKAVSTLDPMLTWPLSKIESAGRHDPAVDHVQVRHPV